MAPPFVQDRVPLDAFALPVMTREEFAWQAATMPGGQCEHFVPTPP